MYCRSTAGKLFQTVGPLTAKPWLVVMRGTESCPDTAERRWHWPSCDEVGKQGRRSHAMPTFLLQHGRLEQNTMPYW